MVERRTFGRWDRGSKPPVVEHRTFSVETTYCRFEAWATSFTQLCLCLSEETVKAVGPFYLVSMSGEVKDIIQENGKNLLWTHTAGDLIL